jgi:DNA-binding MurR/RpiR family transcriptional regulator
MSSVQNESYESYIADQIASLKPSERQVAQYVLDQPEEALFATAGELGSASGTSDATVIRTAKTLGYSGLPDLKRHLAQHLTKRTEPAARLSEQISRGARLGPGRITRLVDEVVDSLKGAEQLLDLVELERSVGLLRSAGRIHTWGLGISSIPAQYAATRLTRLGLDAMNMEASGFKMADELLTVRRGHVVVLFVPGRHHSDIDVILDHAAGVGASAILITGTLGQSMRRKVDAVLTAPTAPSKLTGEVFAGMLISDILIVEVSALMEEQATATNALLTKIRQNL